MLAAGDVFNGYSLGCRNLAALSTEFEAAARTDPILRARIEQVEDGGHTCAVSAVAPEIFITDADTEFPLTRAESISARHFLRPPTPQSGDRGYARGPTDPRRVS
ncbi:hypothetical protein AB4305_26285 [Nocardia sp. 2YAB30]|uniref:hypothetical protein n=1 Tax=unclassified Nocardia TaxID=2637762 RepID=UPI003F988C59